jgi:hypothetical protein
MQLTNPRYLWDIDDIVMPVHPWLMINCDDNVNWYIGIHTSDIKPSKWVHTTQGVATSFSRGLLLWYSTLRGGTYSSRYGIRRSKKHAPLEMTMYGIPYHDDSRAAARSTCLTHYCSTALIRFTLPLGCRVSRCLVDYNFDRG